MNQVAVGFAQMYDASLLKHISGPAPLELERFLYPGSMAWQRRCPLSHARLFKLRPGIWI
jgi:hypothetical protein